MVTEVEEYETFANCNYYKSAFTLTPKVEEFINYGMLIWGQECKTYLEKIYKLQKWVLRIISNTSIR